MRISVPGRNERGLTLVELLVVMLIIGFTAGMVMLAAPRGETGLSEAMRAAERQIAALRDEAVYGGKLLAIRNGEAGFDVLEARGGEWQVRERVILPPSVSASLAPDSTWRLPEHPEEILFGRPLGEDEEEEEAEAPDMVFAPSGEVTPARLELTTAGGEMVLRIDSFGKITREDAS
jgi:general secretion pathway protein H